MLVRSRLAGLEAAHGVKEVFTLNLQKPQPKFFEVFEVTRLEIPATLQHMAVDLHDQVMLRAELALVFLARKQYAAHVDPLTLHRLRQVVAVTYDRCRVAFDRCEVDAVRRSEVSSGAHSFQPFRAVTVRRLVQRHFANIGIVIELDRPQFRVLKCCAFTAGFFWPTRCEPAATALPCREA